MMILGAGIIGIGTDLVDCRRIEGVYERLGERFVKRLLSPKEEKIFRLRSLHKSPASFLAKAFAAKEAVLKALGTGLSQGIRWHDVVVGRTENRKPTVWLEGEALRHLQRLTASLPSSYITPIDLSLADEWPYAQAFAIVSARHMG